MAVIKKSANCITVDISSGNKYGLDNRIQIDYNGNDVSNPVPGNYLDLAFYAIRYKKEIYKPGYVDIDMIFLNDLDGNPSFVDSIRKYFIGITTKLNVTNSSTEDKDDYVAKGYYFCSVNMQSKDVDYLNGSDRVNCEKIVVTARAYSPDYFLTLAKYSKAYVGRKLSDIIREKLASKPSLSQLFPTEDEGLNLCHTTVGNSSNEILQPYLVQYNESFHDFVVRVANRCGELFYYENGKLLLGVDGDTLDSGRNFVVKDSLYTKPSNYNFFEVPAEFMDDVAEFSKSLIDKNGDKKTGSVGDDGMYRNAVVGSDDYLRKVTEDDSIGAWDIMEPHWLECLHNAFQGTSVISAAAEAAKSLALVPSQSGFTAWSLRLEDKVIDKNNKVFSETGMSKSEKEKLVKEFKERYVEIAENKIYFQKSTLVDMSDDEKKTEWNRRTSLPYKAWKDYQKLAAKVPGEYIDDFKRNYEVMNPSLFVTKTEKKKDDVWADATSNASLALGNEKNKHDQYVTDKKKEFEQTEEWKRAKASHVEWTDEQMWKNDPVCKGYLESLEAFNEGSFKMTYELEHPDDFCTITPLTDTEKKTLWEDATKEPYKALADYKKNDGKKYVDIDTKKSGYRNGDGKGYFDSGISESEERAIWNDADLEKKNGKDIPYTWLYEQFKADYEKSHADMFKKKSYGKMMSSKEQDDVWKDAESIPHRDLMKYQSSLDKNVDNLYNIFYTWMEKKEKMVTDSMLVNDSDGYVPIAKLGYCVNFKDAGQTSSSQTRKYMVHGVECNISMYVTLDTSNTPKQKYKVSGSTTVFEMMADSRRKQQYGYQTQMFPPLSDVPHVRKAEPQQAIISNIADPLRMGRVQIRYPWEKFVKDATCSPWIPMTTPFTGNDNGGFLMTPNPNDYVMVDYEDGNVERPFVSGSLYKDTTSWGSTPILAAANKFDAPHRAITTSGNGITFVDGKNEKFVSGLFPGALGLILKATVPSLSEEKKVGGGLVLSDWYGLYNISMSSATRTINIDSPWGSVNMSAFTGINIKCPNGDINIEGKNVNISAGNKITLQSGTNIKSNSMSEDAGIAAAGALGSLGMSLLSSGLQKVSPDASTVLSKVTKLFDCSFLRNVWEIAMRPVDGSLTINSNRNVIMQSGGGKVNVPADTLSQISKPEKGKGWSAIGNVFSLTSNDSKEAEAKDNMKWNNSSWAFYHVAKTYQNVCREYLDEVDKLVKNCLLYETIDFSKYSTHIKEAMTNEVLTQKVWDMEELPSVDDLLVERFPGIAVVNPDNVANVVINDYSDAKRTAEYNQIKSVFDDAKQVLNSLVPVADIKDQIKKKLEKVVWGEKEDTLKAALIPNRNFTDITKELATVNAAYMQAARFKATLKDGNKLNKESLVQFDKDAYLKEYSRAIVLAIAKVANANGKLRSKDIGAVNIASISGILATAEIGEPKKSDYKSKLASAALAGAGLGDFASYDPDKGEWQFMNSMSKLFNVNGKAGTRSLWDVSNHRGSILLSANGLETMELGKDGRGWKPLHNARGTSMKEILESLGLDAEPNQPAQ